MLNLKNSPQLTRDSQFYYTCIHCSRCCHNNRIQVNPYEIARIAKNLGLTTTKIIDLYLQRQKPYLKLNPDGSCIFFKNKRCTVYQDRPLVCRLFPLAQRITGEDKEIFIQFETDSQARGVFGQQGTVELFLKEHETSPFFEARDKYRQMFFMLLELLQVDVDENAETSDTLTTAFLDQHKARQVLLEWFDIDKVLANISDTTRVIPDDLNGRMGLHIKVLKSQLT